MRSFFQSKTFKRFGVAYLVYEALCLVASLTFGLQFLHIG